MKKKTRSQKLLYIFIREDPVHKRVFGLMRIYPKRTRPDTRHKMRLVGVFFTFENNTGWTYGPTDGRTDEPTRPFLQMRRRI